MQAPGAKPPSQHVRPKRKRNSRAPGGVEAGDRRHVQISDYRKIIMKTPTSGSMHIAENITVRSARPTG